MKRFFILLSFLVAGSGFFFLSSCKSVPEPTLGNLKITLIDKNDSLLGANQVFLAKSWDDIKSGKYSASGWTNTNGVVNFIDLVPGFYWYKAEYYQDYGATEVYAGIDHYIIFMVRTPINNP